MGKVRATALPGFEWLEGKGANVHSQFGEDGLVRAVFERIGTTNKWCFEVGAANGVWLSNTKQWIDEGWNAVLIESDPKKFAELKKRKSARVHVIHETVGRDSMDTLLGGLAVPLIMDFGCIDVDGQDYWVWEGMKRYVPRVMLLEFSPYHGPDAMCEKDGSGQAGLNPILALGESKGYVPVAQTYCNVVFVKKELLS